MALTTKVFYRGAAATSNTTLYTTASTETAIITNILVTNTAGTSATYTINIDGIAAISGSTIAANGVTAIDLKQPLIATGSTKTISGSASATTVNFHVSGVTL